MIVSVLITVNDFDAFNRLVVELAGTSHLVPRFPSRFIASRTGFSVAVFAEQIAAPRLLHFIDWYILAAAHAGKALNLFFLLLRHRLVHSSL